MPAPSDDPSALSALAELLGSSTTVALSGAGISTESGIPDYRGPSSAGRARTPITYQAFVREERARRRYWARAMVGWRVMRDKRPNAGHFAIADLERAGHLNGVVTQNVDGLHQAAGSRNVIELHGTLSRARCLNCGRYEQRDPLQARLDALNLAFAETVATNLAKLAPDGDADVPEALLAGFVIADCLVCGGVLKPDVVFFGENVPKPRLENAWALLATADNLLVVGTSLSVMSGYRFVRAYADAGKPIAIINHGPTRGDDAAAVRIDGRLGTVLPSLVTMLAASSPT